MKAGNVRRASIGILAVTLLVAPARAEESSPLLPGQRVRVAAAAPGRFIGVMVGSVVKIGPDSLTLVDPKGGSVTELPLNSITRVEVSRQRRHTRQGLLIGAAVGIAGGALAASGYSEVGCGTSGGPYVNCNYSDAEKVGFVALGAVGGAGIGAWFGHRKQSDDWSDVPVERLRLTARPERRGGRVALTFLF